MIEEYSMNTNIKERVQMILEKIDAARRRSGRSDEVKLMAVSKFRTIAEIEQAIEAGILLFGENRVQEAQAKFPQIFSSHQGLTLHMIGSLQRNKVKTIVPLVSCIQSLDRIELLEEIQKYCKANQKKIDVLLEVHTGEESKAGFMDENQIYRALDILADSSSWVVPKGFMTMAPFTNNEQAIRNSFKKLYTIQQRCKTRYTNFSLDELSMGMSNDFEIAIEEGASLVRIGSALFAT